MRSLLTLGPTMSALTAAPLEFSGIYPSLAYFNNEGECGTREITSDKDCKATAQLTYE